MVWRAGSPRWKYLGAIDFPRKADFLLDPAPCFWLVKYRPRPTRLEMENASETPSALDIGWIEYKLISQ